MGGTNEKTVKGLRMHVSGAEVHVHDDTKNLKFHLAKKTFKEEVDEAFEELKSTDGIVKISGNSGCDFCICKEGSVHTTFLTDNKDTKRQLVSFVKGY